MKHTLFALTLLLAVSLAACTVPHLASTPVPVSTTDDQAEVRRLVESFGRRLQAVSLMAPDAAQQAQRQYSEFVSPALLASWRSDISKAPGRIVSSPWPDRIEISTLERQTPDRYVITGFVVEVTSTEVVGGGAAGRIPVRVIAERYPGRWLIADYREEP